MMANSENQVTPPHPPIRGEGSELLSDHRTALRDLKLVVRSIREGWDSRVAIKALCIDRIGGLVQAPNDDTSLKAVVAFVAIEKLNLNAMQLEIDLLRIEAGASPDNAAAPKLFGREAPVDDV